MTVHQHTREGNFKTYNNVLPVKQTVEAGLQDSGVNKKILISYISVLCFLSISSYPSVVYLTFNLLLIFLFVFV